MRKTIVSILSVAILFLCCACRSSEQTGTSASDNTDPTGAVSASQGMDVQGTGDQETDFKSENDDPVIVSSQFALDSDSPSAAASDSEEITAGNVQTELTPSLGTERIFNDTNELPLDYD